MNQLHILVFVFWKYVVNILLRINPLFLKSKTYHQKIYISKNYNFISHKILGVLQQAHTQMSSASGGSSSSTTSSIHPNYGFDHVEICLDDAVEVQSPDINRRSNPCCLFCKSKKCTNFKWKLKATFGGLTER